MSSQAARRMRLCDLADCSSPPPRGVNGCSRQVSVHSPQARMVPAIEPRTINLFESRTTVAMRQGPNLSPQSVAGVVCATAKSNIDDAHSCTPMQSVVHLPVTTLRATTSVTHRDSSLSEKNSSRYHRIAEDNPTKAMCLAGPLHYHYQ